MPLTPAEAKQAQNLIEGRIDRLRENLLYTPPEFHDERWRLVKLEILIVLGELVE